MAAVITLILICVLVPLETAHGRFWHGVQFPGGISVPCTRDDADFVKWTSGSSLVFVKEVRHTVLGKQNVIDFKSPDFVRQVPSEVELEYRIEEVFVGDSSLQGKLVSALVLEHIGKSLKSKPYLSEWVPALGDEGIWLVKQVDGKLICVSITVLGVRFPVYASEAHRRSFDSHKCRYKDMLKFAQTLKHSAKNQHRLNRQYWTELASHANVYVAQWAIWELSRRYGSSAIETLKTICDKPHDYPMVQAIADDCLLSLDKQWHSSPGRQSMVKRWLSQENPRLAEVFTKYMSVYFSDGELHRYKLPTLKKQALLAMSTRAPASLEWHFLNSFVQNIDKKIAEMSNPDGPP